MKSLLYTCIPSAIHYLATLVRFACQSWTLINVSFPHRHASTELLRAPNAVNGPYYILVELGHKTLQPYCLSYPPTFSLSHQRFLQKLTVAQLVMNYLVFYGIRRFRFSHAFLISPMRVTYPCPQNQINSLTISFIPQSF